MNVSVGDIVIPGDIIEGISRNENKGKVIVGHGLRRIADQVVVCKSGVLQKRKSTYWIDANEKRYVPQRGDPIVGVIANKAGDYFKVDIGSSELASLHYLAFEGATKKNRPNLLVGDVLYATLIIASKDMEPELVCIDSAGKKGKLGVLDSEGLLFKCSLNLVRKLLNRKCPLLKRLGELGYEIAVGMNGKVFVKAKDIKTTIAIANAILDAEHLTISEIQERCEKTVQALF